MYPAIAMPWTRGRIPPVPSFSDARHVGRDVPPESTREHRVGKHKTGHKAPGAEPDDATPPAK